ncbi:MAG: hypothetical protein R3174_04025 [Gammaproteobacteria bacterium]|nr:hypothetical protein [Gammaproteobacteria bacterium]
MCTVFAYAPGLSGPFVFDDTPNLLQNPYVQPASLSPGALRDAALSLENSGFGRPLASVSFALNHFFAGGFDSFAFKLTNLAIHCINGWLIFLLTGRMVPRLMPPGRGALSATAASYLPLVVSAVWLLHPLQLTSVLYVVQRMNSLSALFVFGGLLLFVEGRIRLADRRRGGLAMMYAGVVGGGLLGVLTKENAALLPLLAAVVELCCFTLPAAGDPRRARLRVFYWLLLVIPYLCALAFLATRPEYVLGTYQSRDFSIWERLLTQPRVLFFYLALILFPVRSQLGLFHDDFPVSSGLLEPVSTIFAIIGWLGLAIVSAIYRRRCPVLIFSLAWFLAGHAMESTIFGLEMVFEHRNYVPGLGPMLGTAYLALWAFDRLRIRTTVVCGLVTLVALTLGFVTYSRAYTWSSEPLLMEALLRHQPNSPRSHIFAAEYFFRTRGDAEKIFYHNQRSAELNPVLIGGLVEMMRIADNLEVDESLNDGESRADNGSSSVFDLELIPSRAQRERILRLSKAEIERRLRHEPIDTKTVAAFRILQACIYRGVVSCRRLASDVADWLEAALGNPRILPQYRPWLLLLAAKIQAWFGNSSMALVYARMAVNESRGGSHFLIELGELYLALGDYESGLAVVERLKKRQSMLELRMADIESLERRLKSASSEPPARGRAVTGAN